MEVIVNIDFKNSLKLVIVNIFSVFTEINSAHFERIFKIFVAKEIDRKSFSISWVHIIITS